METSKTGTERSSDYRATPYFHASRASDLTGNDRTLYRFFEMLPGIITWLTILATIILSRYFPITAAICIIIFDVYWLLKTAYLSIYLRQNWKRMKHNMTADWVTLLSHLKHDHLYHIVILPFYKEGKEVVEKSVDALLSTHYDPKKLIVVLAAEARAGKPAEQIAEEVKKHYEAKFGHVLITIHPDGIVGEQAGKGANISYAARETGLLVLDAHKIAYADAIVSAFDIDTVVYPHYFQCLTWYFLTVDRPFRSSFQPVPFYNNNIWEAPAFSRVVATSGTFWQMIQQERPERLATFSSHAVSFKTLYEVGFWQKNMVSEDSRIFWNCFVAFDGDYDVIPLSYPVSMDANLAENFWQTCKNVYKQQRRWAYGSENLPYILMAFAKNPRISKRKKWYMSIVQLEGYWSLATHPLVIFLLGWLPLVIGGSAFNSTLLSYNLPYITRILMDLSLLGLVLSAIISFSFLPPPSKKVGVHRKAFMILQWILVPFTMIIFGAFPAIDAQTRLMLGKYMGFWVTPKHQKKL